MPHRTRPNAFAVLAIALGFASPLVSGCSSPGRWGHSRAYAPTSEESKMIAQARDFDAPMARLKPEAWQGALVRFFMVVDQRQPGPDGASYLRGKIHTLNEINGCENRYDESSCRVTIKPGAHDTVHVAVRLHGDDDAGVLHVFAGTLVRVVGVLSDKPDPKDGKLVIRATWYRQWPAGYYAREGEVNQ